MSQKNIQNYLRFPKMFEENGFLRGDRKGQEFHLEEGVIIPLVMESSKGYYRM